MAKRYPVTTPTPGGSVAGGLYRAISPPVLGDRYPGGRAYQMAVPTLFNRSTYTVGIVHRKVREYEGNSGDAEYLLGYNDATITGGGFRLERRTGGPPDEKGGWRAFVGNTLVDSHYASGVTNYEGRGPSEMGLHFQALVVDNDAYPDDLWFHNGRHQGTAEGDTLLPLSNWSDDGLGQGGKPFSLGGDNVLTVGARDPIVGMFYHLDALSFYELTVLFMNTMRFKDIPDTDPTGLGTVPDHIWSVKRAGMVPGEAALTPWVSDGAVGGESLTLINGSTTVIEFDDTFVDVR